MKTIKPIATISYNSASFLNGTLNRLADNGLIEFYAYIRHEPEEDETKAHYHVFVLPAQRIDTIELRKMFNEIELEKFAKLSEEEQKSYKPLGCMPFEKSDWANWYWYGIHDVAYLASKGQSRKYHYSIENVISNMPDYLAHKVAENPRPCGEVIRSMEAIAQGLNDMQIACMLNTNVRNLGYTLNGLEMIRNYTYRNGNEGHEKIEQKTIAEKKLETAVDDIEDIKYKVYHDLPEGKGRSEVLRMLHLLEIGLKEKK